MPPVSPSGPLSRARSRAALGIDRAAGRADAYAARCLAALGRVRATGRRTSRRTVRVRVILCCAEARSALLHLGRRFVARTQPRARNRPPRADLADRHGLSGTRAGNRVVAYTPP